MLRIQFSFLFIIAFLTLNFSAVAQSYSTADAKKYQALVGKVEISEHGFMSVHKSADNLWLEIPEEIMGRDLLIACRLDQVSSSNTIAAGQMRNNPILVRFSHDDQNVYLHPVNTKESVNKNDAISISFERNRMITVMEVFKIEAVNPETNACLIDVTKFFNTPIEGVSPFGDKAAPGKLVSELTNTVHVRAYDKNIELVTSMGFEGRREPFFCHMHRSILLLSKEPMQPRLSDPKMGYYDEAKKEFSSNKIDVESFGYIKRWRMEPKDEDLEKYQAGQLVEPQKPIVFYVDNAFPAKWRNYIKAGIEDWQSAFEAIGFKNAIQAKDYPEKDSAFQMNDITKSCFRYVTEETANAAGNAWIDPRSGEIIQGSVIWYHDVIKKLYQWRFAQTAANDPAIRGDKDEIDEKILGDLIRYAAAHEIGHCLGMKHNYRASYAFPVDSLRSVSFTHKYGTAASIMDYARNNYIAQPQDKGVRLTPPTLGVFDYLSLKWAYQPVFSAATPEEEREILNGWLADKNEDDMYLYGTKNGMGDGCMDPSVLSESLGNDLVKAGRYGVANIKIIMQNLVEWTAADKTGDANLQQMYEAVLKQYSQYLNHTETLLGGMYEFEITNPTHPNKFEAVPKKKQKEALEFMMDELLSQFDWMSTPEFERRMGSLDQEVMKSQGKIVEGLINRMVLVRIFTCSGMSAQPYYVGEYLSDIRERLFSVSSKKQSAHWMMNLQCEYVKTLQQLLEKNSADGGHPFNNLVMADILAELDAVHALVSKNAEKGDVAVRNHFAYLKYITEQ